MEQYKKLIIRDFSEHIVPDAPGMHLKLYHFDPYPFQAQHFKLAFSIKTTHYSSVDREIIVLPKAKMDSNEKKDNISFYTTIDIPSDKNLYIQVEKPANIMETMLPMNIWYQVYH